MTIGSLVRYRIEFNSINRGVGLIIKKQKKKDKRRPKMVRARFVDVEEWVFVYKLEFIKKKGKLVRVK